MLPEIRTDIVIENKIKRTQLIIDTKYYGQTLVSGYRADCEKVRTSHLYQVFAYISNSTFAGNIQGMLLYPTIKKEVDVIFPIRGKRISVRTLNLDAEWQDVMTRLLVVME